MGKLIFQGNFTEQTAANYSKKHGERKLIAVYHNDTGDITIIDESGHTIGDITEIQFSQRSGYSPIVMVTFAVTDIRFVTERVDKAQPGSLKAVKRLKWDGKDDL